MEGPTKAPMRLCARASGDEPPCVLAWLLKGDAVVDLLGLRHDVLGEADRLRANLCPWDRDEVYVAGEAPMHRKRVAVLARDLAQRLDQEIIFLLGQRRIPRAVIGRAHACATPTISPKRSLI